MSYPEERLIPVRSESELKVGMTVVRKACMDCERDHVEILLRPDTIPCREHRMRSWWAVSDCFCKVGCYHLVISEGRLFRLDTREKTKERTRELERVR